MINRALILIIVSLVSCGYGIALGIFKFFPYEIVRDSYSFINQIVTVNEIDDAPQILTNVDDKVYAKPGLKDGLFVISFPNLTPETVIAGNYGTFVARTLELEGEFSKIAGLEHLEGDRISFLPQVSDLMRPVMFGYESWGNKGGIKGFRRFDAEIIAVVAGEKLDSAGTNCSTVKIVLLAALETIAEGECLSGAIDLSGAGGGITVSRDGILLVAIGTPTADDQAVRELAQDSSSFYGKVYDLTEIDGEWSLKMHSSGHRNPQGLFLHENDVFAVEHGPRGGDELNKLIPGGNYGWPHASYGLHYHLAEIPFHMVKDGYQAPLHVFSPSIGISDLAQCPSNYPISYMRKKCLVISSMRAKSLYFLVFDDFDRVIFSEQVEIGFRVRRIRNHKDYLWLATDQGEENAKIIRLEFKKYNAK